MGEYTKRGGELCIGRSGGVRQNKDKIKIHETKYCKIHK